MRSGFVLFVLAALIAILSAPMASDAGVTANASHEDILIARANGQLAAMTERRADYVRIRAALASASTFDLRIQGLRVAAADSATGPADLATELKNKRELALDTWSKVQQLQAQNGVIQNTLDFLKKQISNCQLSTRVQAAVSGSAALVNQHSVGQKNAVAIAGLVVPLVFYQCDSSQNPNPTPSPGAQDMSLVTKAATPQIDTGALSETLFASTLDPQTLATESNPSSLDAYQNTLTAQVNALTEQQYALINEKDGADTQNAHCKFASKLQTAVAGATALVGTSNFSRDIADKNMIAISGLLIPVVFYQCDFPKK